jgi:hypothetical protein
MEQKARLMLVPLDGREYDLEVIVKTTRPVDAPRLVVVSHLVNQRAVDLLAVCLRCVERFTPEPHELWVVDNNSPRENLDWLLKVPNVNLVLNHTEPLPVEGRSLETEAGAVSVQRNWGSYANAVGLELAARLVNQDSFYFMSMHMDALPCQSGWLSFLLSKLGPVVKAAGVRMDKVRTPGGVLHVLGYVVDFQLFRKLGLDFFPELPHLDVGDKVTVKLRQAGYQVFACPSTLWDPDLVLGIPRHSPLRDLHADRSYDEDGNVIFLHLGRGLRKSDGDHRKGTTVEEWIRFAREVLLA